MSKLKLGTYIVEYAKEVVWSPWSGVGTGVHTNETVPSERCVVCIEVRLRAVGLTRHGEVPEGGGG